MFSYMYDLSLSASFNFVMQLVQKKKKKGKILYKKIELREKHLKKIWREIGNIDRYLCSLFSVADRCESGYHKSIVERCKSEKMQK